MGMSGNVAGFLTRVARLWCIFKFETSVFAIGVCALMNDLPAPPESGTGIAKSDEELPSIADFYGGSICLMSFSDVIVMGMRSGHIDVSYIGCLLLSWLGIGLIVHRRTKSLLNRYAGSLLLSGGLVYLLYLFARLLRSICGNPFAG